MEREINNQSVCKRGISGSTLKIIALVTMLIDHIGAVVVIRMMFARAAEMGVAGGIIPDELYESYQLMRGVGRIAFPIYCFLLVEGFQRTRNKAKYALRLGVFALLSELPFDLAFSSTVLEFSYQNVFFTLFVGMLTLLVMERVEMRMCAGERKGILSVAVRCIAIFLIPAAGAIAAELLRTDYGAKGVLCIVILYLFRWNKPMQLIAGACSFLWESVASLAFLPIAFYSGQRGWNLKYVFYMFYPLHLLILYLICVAMGISGYAVV